ncbi:MAG TPA: M1 family aminopeptidase [Pyrinomonadaceae bacterium]|nr:M1 family aminopeptidase [Pyrinomonadaceae bacterium]
MRKLNPVVQLICFLLCGLFVSSLYAQDASPSKELALYNQIKAFDLNEGAIDVKGLVLKKDRTQITLDGVVYLSASATGAVFIGDGKFALETPPSDFENENIKRLLGTEIIESDFKTAVFRFTDDTATQLGQPHAAPANARAQKLASEMEPRILRETGANISARVALSILNKERPGFFFANFDGGKRGRFSFVLDYQTRIPVANFEINAGEKGLIFSYNTDITSREVWAAFYSLEDYERHQVAYSDTNDLIDIQNYEMDVDLREHKKRMRLRAHVVFHVLSDIRALCFKVGETLPDTPDWRLKKQMRVKSIKMDDNNIPFAQEDWEGGFTLFLPDIVKSGSALNADFELEGDFMYDSESIASCHYPRSNETWFPRHGYLDRATFNMTYRHPKNLRVASGGLRLSEEPDPDDKDATVTKYQMAQPVPLVTFGLGPFKRHSDVIKWEKGGADTPLEFNSLPGDVKAIKEDFILAELSNSVRYFTSLFGRYPYPSFGAAFHPFNYGQGFPSLLMIPATDRANKRTFQFIAHETAHQWWGGIVAWRSYRDQWLSEGFAEYSGILYTLIRENRGAEDALISELRTSLRDPPQTLTGPGKGRLIDVGPIILGHRLSTSKTFGAYQTLIYNKGALVLRMLHFLMTDPNSGDGQPFFNMMTDFVTRYRNQTASTDDFRRVANEHFARTPIAKEYNLPDLNWLFLQMVYQTALPSYELQYRITGAPDGKFMLSGTVVQQNTPNDWVMVLPLKLEFGDNQRATTTVIVQGASTPFQMRLPLRPRKVELDPDHWILSERTSTKGN